MLFYNAKMLYKMLENYSVFCSKFHCWDTIVGPAQDSPRMIQFQHLQKRTVEVIFGPSSRSKLAWCLKDMYMKIYISLVAPTKVPKSSTCQRVRTAL